MYILRKIPIRRGIFLAFLRMILIIHPCYHSTTYPYLYEKKRSSMISPIPSKKDQSMQSSERMEVGSLPLHLPSSIILVMRWQDHSCSAGKVYPISPPIFSQIVGCFCHFRMFLRSQVFDFSNTFVRYIHIISRSRIQI